MDVILIKDLRSSSRLHKIKSTILWGDPHSKLLSELSKIGKEEEKKLGIRSSATTEVIFDQCRIPKES